MSTHTLDTKHFNAESSKEMWTNNRREIKTKKKKGREKSAPKMIKCGWIASCFRLPWHLRRFPWKRNENHTFRMNQRDERQIVLYAIRFSINAKTKCASDIWTEQSLFEPQVRIWIFGQQWSQFRISFVSVRIIVLRSQKISDRMEKIRDFPATHGILCFSVSMFFLDLTMW